MVDGNVGSVGELVGIDEEGIVGHEECNIDQKGGHRGQASRSGKRPRSGEIANILGGGSDDVGPEVGSMSVKELAKVKV